MIERSTIARIGKELAEMQTLLKSVQTKFTALDYDDDDILNWKVTILGPQKTPYAGGSFVLRISFPYNYPKAPPSVIFETTIYHPNIDTQTGRVCNPYLSREKAWTKDVKISMILYSILDIMEKPNSDDPVVPKIAKLHKKRPKKFEKEARKWTEKYATNQFQPEFQPQSQSQSQSQIQPKFVARITVKSHK